MKVHAQGRRAVALERAPEFDSMQRSAVISFSSEYPVERWAMGQTYQEVLSHEPGAMMTERLDGTVNVIDSHDTGSIDSILGVVERAWLGEDKRGYAAIRFADTERAQRAARMMADGILRNVSFGYRIHDYADLEGDTLRVTRWQPYEISLLSTPADPTVGYMRALDAGAGADAPMIDVTSRAAPANTPPASADTMKGQQMEQAVLGAGNASPQVQITQDHVAEGQAERTRIMAIMEAGRQYQIDQDTVQRWIASPTSMNDVTASILAIISERAKANPKPVGEIGLTAKETQAFSLSRMLNAMYTGDTSKVGFEMAASNALAQKLGKMPEKNRFFVPAEIQAREIAQRDMAVSPSTAGGYLVQQTNQGFIPLLRNRAVAYRMGATQMPGLQDNTAIPKMTAGASFGWLANEATAATESTPTIGQLLMTPKTIAGYVEVSRLLTLQASPSAEALIQADLADGVAVAIDSAVLSGTGAAGQPTGIIATAGIGGVVGTTLGFAGILEFQTDIAGANVMPARGGYITTPTVAALMKQRVKFTSTASPLWEGNIWDGRMEGMPAMSSLQVPAANMLFGDWASVVIGEWGVMQIEMNPYANFAAGIIGFRVFYSCDVGVRYAGAWSLATTIT